MTFNMHVYMYFDGFTRQGSLMWRAGGMEWRGSKGIEVLKRGVGERGGGTACGGTS